MPFATLTRLLAPELGAEASKRLERARQATGSGNPGEWLAWMVAQGQLTPGRRAALLTALATAAGETGAGDPGGTPFPRLTAPPDASVPGGRLTVADPFDDGTAFLVGALLGRGGMGAVYRATDRVLGREVAFKLLTEHRLPMVRERFIREARITAQLDHPNIVPIHVLEMSPTDEHIGYAMKLVEGRTLAQLIRETAALRQAGRPVDDTHAQVTLLEHFLKICDAIAFAHSRGVLHRDLKPANIMIGPFNEVYVMDWGVARRIGPTDEPETDLPDMTPPDEPALTRIGQVVGTPRYMSPEQARGLNDQLDGRSDE